MRALWLALVALLLAPVAVWAEPLELHTESCRIALQTPVGWEATAGDAEHVVLRRGDQASVSIRLVESPERVDLDTWIQDLRERLRRTSAQRPTIQSVELRPVQSVSFQYGPGRQFDMITHMKAAAAPPWTRTVVVKVAPRTALEVFLVGLSPESYRQSLPTLSTMLQGIQVQP